MPSYDPRQDITRSLMQNNPMGMGKPHGRCRTHASWRDGATAIVCAAGCAACSAVGRAGAGRSECRAAGLAERDAARDIDRAGGTWAACRLGMLGWMPPGMQQGLPDQAGMGMPPGMPYRVTQ